MEIIVFIGYTDGYIMFIVADCGIQVDQQNDIHIIISIAHVAPNSGKYILTVTVVIHQFNSHITLGYVDAILATRPTSFLHQNRQWVYTESTLEPKQAQKIRFWAYE